MGESAQHRGISRGLGGFAAAGSAPEKLCSSYRHSLCAVSVSGLQLTAPGTPGHAPCGQGRPFWALGQQRPPLCSQAALLLELGTGAGCESSGGRRENPWKCLPFPLSECGDESWGSPEHTQGKGRAREGKQGLSKENKGGRGSLAGTAQSQGGGSSPSPAPPLTCPGVFPLHRSVASALGRGSGLCWVFPWLGDLCCSHLSCQG